MISFIKTCLVFHPPSLSLFFSLLFSLFGRLFFPLLCHLSRIIPGRRVFFSSVSRAGNPRVMRVRSSAPEEREEERRAEIGREKKKKKTVTTGERVENAASPCVVPIAVSTRPSNAFVRLGEWKKKRKNRRGVAQWREIPPQPNRRGNDFIRSRSAMDGVCVHGGEREKREKKGLAEAETVQKINIEGNPRMRLRVKRVYVCVCVCERERERREKKMVGIDERRFH